MVIHRKNLQPHNGTGSAPGETGEACFRAMQRHAGAAVRVPIATPGAESVPVPVHKKPPGDIIYGAKAIARYLFDDDSNRARRRVFNLWTHYRDREEAAGFFKLKGALCLSKSQWQAFHGLG